MPRVNADPDFVAAYEAHVWDVYGFLAFRTRSREEAEDLTQETFVRALKGWARFDPSRSAAKPWLLAIARNVYVDSRRRSRSRPRTTAEVAAAEPAGEEDRDLARIGGPDPACAAALARLRRREREAVALRFGGDLRTAEIAEVMGVSVANAQQILSRALRRMRELMEDPATGSESERAGARDPEPGHR